MEIILILIMEYKSIITASGATHTHLKILNESIFKLLINSQWMGSNKINITLDGFVKTNSPTMKTLYTKTLKNELTNEIINLQTNADMQDNDSSLVFRLLDVGNNIPFDLHDYVAGCVLAGGGTFNTCRVINNKKCEKNCNKCFTYDSILMGCIGNSFDEDIIEEKYKEYCNVLKYNLMRKID